MAPGAFPAENSSSHPEEETLEDGGQGSGKAGGWGTEVPTVASARAEAGGLVQKG